jgi:hypothetical protein
MSVKVSVKYKVIHDYDWRGPETLSLTRIPSIDEYIVAGPFEFKLCRVKMVIHTPTHSEHDAEVYCDYVERTEALGSVEKFELYQPGSNTSA